MLTEKQFKRLKPGDELIATNYDKYFNNKHYINAFIKNSSKLPVKLISRNGEKLSGNKHHIDIEYSSNGYKDHQIVYAGHLELPSKLPEEYKDSDILEE